MVGIVLYMDINCCLVQQTINAAGARAHRNSSNAIIVWSPRVRVESKHSKGGFWRPPASNCQCAKSFVFAENTHN